jgi:hypothetical protein
MVGFSAMFSRRCSNSGQFSGFPSKRISYGLVISVKCAYALWYFIGCAGVVFIVRRLGVSIFFVSFLRFPLSIFLLVYLVVLVCSL